MQLNWSTDGDIELFLSQDRLIEDYLIDRLDLINYAKTPEENTPSSGVLAILSPSNSLILEN